MPFYFWKGINPQGNSIKGIWQAATPDQLKELLLNQQIALLAFNEQHNSSWIGCISQRRISTKQISDFFERLSLLITNGVELIPALEVVAQLTPQHHFVAIIKQMIRAIGQGQSFHAALQSYPLVFSPYIVHLIEAGEKTGQLGQMLENLTKSLAQQLWLQSQLKQAALTPLITLGVAVILIGSILIFILPHFQSLYQSLGSTLPPATQWLISLHQTICSPHGFVLLAGLIACISLLGFLAKNVTIKRWLQTITLKIPIIRHIIITSCLVSFAQTLSILLAAGLPLTQALSHIQQATQNLIFKNDVERISLAILDGDSLYNAVKRSKSLFFDQQFLALINVGEHSGKLAHVLKNASEQYQENLASNLAILTTFFAPGLMILVGLLIGIIMVLIYLPIFNLGNLFGQ